MPECGQVYKCELCGNIVMVIHGGAGNLVCCGQNMVQMTENTVDAAKEKHVPVVEKVDGGFKVKVGSIAHPMEEKHYIEWIEVWDGQQAHIHPLKPGDTPEAIFNVKEVVKAREYCNLHGLWRT